MSAILSLAKFFSTRPLTRDAQLGAWLRFASWQIRSRLQDEVIFHWIGGQRLAVRRGMTGATGNIYVGLHEFPDMMLTLHFLREGDVFIDVGANIGSYSVLAGGVRRASVWAIEPDPDTARALKRNVALNALQERMTVCEFAVGEYEGEVTFTRGLDTVNRVATATDHNVQRVPMRRLDSLFLPERPSMIKMDVEGHEEAALRGCRGLLSAGSLKVIELETVTPEIEATLDGHGFKRAFYDPFRRALTVSPNDMAANNSIFVRDWDFVVARLASAPAMRVFEQIDLTGSWAAPPVSVLQSGSGGGVADQLLEAQTQRLVGIYGIALDILDDPLQAVVSIKSACIRHRQGRSSICRCYRCRLAPAICNGLASGGSRSSSSPPRGWGGSLAKRTKSSDPLARIGDHPAYRIADLLPWNGRAAQAAA